MVFSSDPLVHGAAIMEMGENGNFKAGMTFSQIPNHPLEVQVTRVFYTAHGPWQLPWQPPAAPAGTAAVPTAAPTLPPTPAPTPTLISDDPLVLEVQALAEKFNAPFQQGPGWVHVVSEINSYRSANRTYPPPYLKEERWYELDGDGFVVGSVSLDLDAGGQVLQQAASRGNYSVNFTFGDTRVNDNPPYRFALSNWAQTLIQAEQSGAHITREEAPCDDGQDCLLITLLDAFAQPVQNPGEEQAFSGSGRRVWIDLGSGQ